MAFPTFAFFRTVSNLVKKPHPSASGIGHWSPPVVIFLALGLAFVLFVALDFAEQFFLAQTHAQQIRLFHLLRGFLATSGGMIFVWQIMRVKELELTRLRDHFADELEKRTKQLNDSLADAQYHATRVKAMLYSMAEGLVELDSNGVVVSANESFERMTGIPSAELVGKPLKEIADRFAPSPDAVSLSDALSNLRTAASDEALYKVDEDTAVLHWALSPIDLPGLHNCVLTFTDITESRRLLDDLSVQREDFLEVINHRLRTPVLANIRVNKLLLEGAFGQLTKEQCNIVDKSLANAEELDRLLIMLMDIYRYRNNRKDLRKENLTASELVRSAAARIQVQPNPGIHLDINSDADGAQVYADKEELSKVLLHLTENALKHARSKVWLSVALDGRQIKFFVRDDGKGMPPEDVKNLFNQFYKISATGKHVPATGVGLCLCEQIAKAHDAQLSCKSEPERGTEFCLIVERSD